MPKAPRRQQGLLSFTVHEPCRLTPQLVTSLQRDVWWGTDLRWAVGTLATRVRLWATWAVACRKMWWGTDLRWAVGTPTIRVRWWAKVLAREETLPTTSPFNHLSLKCRRSAATNHIL